MEKVLLISETTLKTYTMINDNIDSKYILPAIQITQDCDLDTIIGPVLNNKLQSLVRDGSITEAVNEHYKKLLDNYITPYLCWQVMSAVQININYKLTNSGTIVNQDERKTSLDYTNARALQSQYEHYAQSYGAKLRDYLCKNASIYPEYKQCENFECAEDGQLCSIYLPSSTNHHEYKGK